MTTSTRKKPLKATLIVNPVSGTGDSKERRNDLTSYAKELGWVGEYRETTKTKTAAQIAKEEISRGVKHIVVCGGDGTIMEALGAVLNKKVILGIVPLGTGNLLARNLSLPLEGKQAMEISLVGNQKLIDIGKANGNYFSIIAGIGLDAEIMQGARREMKDRWGQFAYVFSTLKKLYVRSGWYEVTLDNKRSFKVRAKTIMASNMGKIVGGLEVVPATDPQSGSLQLGIIKARTFSSWINITLHALLGSIDNSPHYDIYKAKSIKVKSLSGPKLYQCDGDFFPKTDTLAIDIYPQSVTVMVSPQELAGPDKNIKNVLVFDFDGTLANSIDMFVTIYNKLAIKHKYPQITPDQRQVFQGMSAKEVIDQLPISKFKLPFIYKEGKSEFEKNIEFIKPFPLLSEVLVKLSKKYTLGIVTSNDAVNVKKFLLNHRMDCFSFVYSDGSLFGKGKVINNLLKKYNYSKENVIYVGDEVRDIDAARHAGIKVISVTWGFNSKKVLKSNSPDFVIDNPRELLTGTFFKTNK